MLKDTNLSIKYITKPWEELEKDFNDYKIDLVHSLIKSKERDEKYLFSDIYLKNTSTFIVHKSSKPIEKIEDLFGKKVAVVKGWYTTKELKKFPQIKLVYFKNTSEMLDAINEKKVYSTILEYSISKYYINNYDYIDLITSGKPDIYPIEKIPAFHFATMKNQGNDYLISILNKALNKLSISKRQELQEKWFGIESFDKNKMQTLTKNEIKYIENNNFNVCAQPDFYPLIALESYKLTGISAKLFDKISKDTKLQYQIVNTKTKNELYQQINKNKCDIVLVLRKAQNKFDNIKTSDSIFESYWTSIGNINSSYIDENTNLSEYTFYVKDEMQKDFISWEYPININTSENINEIMKKVQDNSLVNYLELSLISDYLVQKFGADKFKINGRLNKISVDISIGVNEKHPILLNIINKSLKNIPKNEINNIISTYKVKEYKIEKNYNKDLVIVLIFIFSLMLILIYKNMQQQEQQKLLEIESKKFKTLLENATDAIHIMDFKGNIILCSPSFQKLLKVENYQLPELKIPDFDMGSSLEDIMKRIEEIKNGETITFSTIFKRMDNEKINVDVLAKEIKIDDVIYIYASARDVTDKEKEKQKRIENQAQLISITNASQDAIIMMNPHGKISFWNPAAQKILGFTKEESIGNDLHNLIASERYIPHFKKAFPHFLKTGTGNAIGKTVELTAKHKLGHEIMVAISLGPVRVKDEWHAVGIIRDITERYKAEQEIKYINENLEKLVQNKTDENFNQFQIIQRQAKLAEMGEMIGAIAHQWRQPLNELGINIQRLEFDYDYNKLDKEYLTKFIEKSEKTIAFMSKTIDNFRNFFKIDKNKDTFSVKEEIEFILNLFSSQYSNHNIEIKITGNDFIIVGFKSEFHEVILNLVNNAKDAFLENNIDTRNININLENNIIEVSDNAGGIKMDVINRVFEPYFTTKEEGKGTGIGLYICKMIIENIGGSIEVENIENIGGSIEVENIENGVKFTITLKDEY